MVLRLRRQAEERIRERREADVGAGVARVAAAVAVAAAVDVARHAAVVRLEDDVHDAGDGIRAVLRGGAVLQHLDVVDGGDGNVVQVGRRAALVRAAQHGQVRRAVAALAVHEHQRIVRRQPAQPRRQRHVGHVAAERLRRQRRQILRQRLQQVGLAGALQRRRVEHLDRRRAVLDFQAARAGAGDDDDARVERARFGGRRCGVGRGLVVVRRRGETETAGQDTGGDAGVENGLVHVNPFFSGQRVMNGCLHVRLCARLIRPHFFAATTSISTNQPGFDSPATWTTARAGRFGWLPPKNCV